MLLANWFMKPRGWWFVCCAAWRAYLKVPSKSSVDLQTEDTYQARW